MLDAPLTEPTEQRLVQPHGTDVADPVVVAVDERLAVGDHRVVDGKEAVTFLVRVKECLEDPQRFVLDL